MPSRKNGLLAFAAAALVLAVAATFALTRDETEDSRPARGASNQETSEPAPPPKPEKVRVQAKGLYMTGWTVGVSRYDKLIKLVEDTELNAVVIDVKDDGAVSYDTEVPLEREVEASRKMFRDPEKILADLEKKNIYTIARISCFRDSVVPPKRPDLAIQNADGTPWKDRAGYTWLNPYKKETWDYNVDIAIDAARKGFKEIQFDYVRFPSEGYGTRVVPDKTEQSAAEVISEFLKYAREKLEAENVWVAVDIFGLTGLVDHDMGIGQTIKSIAENVDYICPMVYPSHYNKGEYGIPDPNREPYQTVYLSVRDSVKRIEGTGAKVRPWLQDFSLYGVTYGPEQVKAQIKAASDAGINEYLLWNPRNRYTAGGLAPAKKEASGGTAAAGVEKSKSDEKPRQGG